MTASSSSSFFCTLLKKNFSKLDKLIENMSLSVAFFLDLLVLNSLFFGFTGKIVWKVSEALI